MSWWRISDVSRDLGNVLMICRGERDESAVVAGTGDEASCARWEEVGGGGW